MTTPCTACAKAENNPLTGLYSMVCDVCMCRRIAQSPEFYASWVARDMLPAYQRTLVAMFGVDRVEQMHAAVKVWAGRIGAARLTMKLAD